jgi:hypothetical protein
MGTDYCFLRANPGSFVSNTYDLPPAGLLVDKVRLSPAWELRGAQLR